MTLFAVLAGCNYPTDEDNILHGCHNDVHRMHKTLVSTFGFDPKNIQVLTDEIGSQKMPTHTNIKNAIGAMIDGAQSGDIMLFFFSGHGTSVEPSDSPTGKKEQAIVPSDENVLTGVDFRILVDRVPAGASFTIVADSCMSGGLIDKEPIQIGKELAAAAETTSGSVAGTGKRRNIPYGLFVEHISSRSGLESRDLGAHMLKLFGAEASSMFLLAPHLHPKPLGGDQGVLLSACQWDELAAEDRHEPGGQFTKGICKIMKEAAGGGARLTNAEVVMRARKIIEEVQQPCEQHPCLYCSEANMGAVFLG